MGVYHSTMFVIKQWSSQSISSLYSLATALQAVSMLPGNWVSGFSRIMSLTVASLRKKINNKTAASDPFLTELMQRLQVWTQIEMGRDNGVCVCVKARRGEQGSFCLAVQPHVQKEGRDRKKEWVCAPSLLCFRSLGYIKCSNSFWIIPPQATISFPLNL